jgi:hypothetical protein
MSLETKHAILDALLASIDEEHALGVIEHRRAKKEPLTAFAAKLLAKQFALCPDPNAAAEEMILRGWTGFKAEWLRKPINRAGKRTVFDVAAERFSNGPESVFGGGRNVECLPGQQQQPGSDDGNLRGSFAGDFPASRH